jgi:hypothetical protein
MLLKGEVLAVIMAIEVGVNNLKTEWISQR